MGALRAFLGSGDWFHSARAGACDVLNLRKRRNSTLSANVKQPPLRAPVRPSLQTIRRSSITTRRKRRGGTVVRQHPRYPAPAVQGCRIGQGRATCRQAGQGYQNSTKFAAKWTIFDAVIASAQAGRRTFYLPANQVPALRDLQPRERRERPKRRTPWSVQPGNAPGNHGLKRHLPPFSTNASPALTFISGTASAYCPHLRGLTTRSSRTRPIPAAAKQRASASAPPATST